jgi:hypothetical protein
MEGLATQSSTARVNISLLDLVLQQAYLTNYITTNNLRLLGLVCCLNMRHIQGVSGGILNILGGDSVDYSE